MKSCIILRGISGCGKSTYVESLRRASSVPVVAVSADKYRYDDDGNYDYDPANNEEVHNLCKRDFASALAKSAPIIVVDNTNISKIDAFHYAKEAKRAGYKVRIIQFECPPEVAHKRSTKGIEWRETMRQHSQLQREYFAPRWAELTIVPYAPQMTPCQAEVARVLGRREGEWLRGYDIPSLSDGKVKRSTVYDHLRSLERKGLVKYRGVQGKKAYALTPLGRKALTGFNNLV